MAALPALITVAQYHQLPDDGNLYELHHGEVVLVTRPKPKHYKLQIRFVRLLESKLRKFGEVVMELPYRPVAEFELRAADVAVLSRARWDAIDPDIDLLGAPELVIEVKSPSNTKAQLQRLATLCLANGGWEFWIVDQANRTVTAIQRDGAATAYVIGQHISLAAFGGDTLSVSDIFA
jgi:Uma2 family endonuclease